MKINYYLGKKVVARVYMLVILIGLLIPLVTSIPVSALSPGDVSPWTTSTNMLPNTLDDAPAVTLNGYAYVFGGYTGSAELATVSYTKLNSDGTTGVWTSTTNLPANTELATAVAYNGYVYVMGGAFVDTVYYAKQNSDGTLGSWSTGNPIPATNFLYATSSVVYNGYVYILAGRTNGGTGSLDVYYAKLNSDGSVGAWTTSPNLMPDSPAYSAAVAYNGYIYFIGGVSSSASNKVYITKLNSDGSTGVWQTSPATLPEVISDLSAVESNGRVYVIGGGTTGFQVLNTVLIAILNSDGTIGNFVTSANSIPSPELDGAAITYNGYVYYIGGTNPTFSNNVYYTSIVPDPTVPATATTQQTLVAPDTGFGSPQKGSSLPVYVLIISSLVGVLFTYSYVRYTKKHVK